MPIAVVAETDLMPFPTADKFDRSRPFSIVSQGSPRCHIDAVDCLLHDLASKLAW